MAYKLFDEGEQMMLDVFLRNGTAPSNFYLGLCNVSGGVANMAETLTLSTLSGEASGGGYSRQLIERSNTGWPTLALNSGDYMATASVETFTASGGTIGPVNVAFLATTSDNTGKLITAVDLSTARTLQDGDSLNVTDSVKQS